jgi:hypothetical protein
MGFNEADTLESSSILIYSKLQAGLYSQWIRLDAALIKWLLKVAKQKLKCWAAKERQVIMNFVLTPNLYRDIYWSKLYSIFKC